MNLYSVIFWCFQFEPLDVYKMSDIETKQRLDQNKLIALAILLGCDYYDGVNKIGKETAVQFLKLKDIGDVLERYIVKLLVV